MITTGKLIYCCHAFHAEVIPSWLKRVEELEEVITYSPYRPISDNVLNELRKRENYELPVISIKNSQIEKPFSEMEKTILECDQSEYSDALELKSLYILSRSDLVVADLNLSGDIGVELTIAWMYNKKIIGVSNKSYINPFIQNKCSLIVRANSPVLIQEIEKSLT